MLQLGKICDKYGINLIYPQPLTYNSGWFAGFFDSDGSIYMNESSGQLFITVISIGCFSWTIWGNNLCYG